MSLINSPKYASLTHQLQPFFTQKRLPQALLLTGPRHSRLENFIPYITAQILCAGTDPCGTCANCLMVLEGSHPDITYIKADQEKVIKVDQIRALQQDIFQTPKKGRHRFVVFTAADKMNTAAANALLKILEEPPSHTLFILIAEQLNTLPATILSRCQRYTLPFTHPEFYLDLLEEYEKGSNLSLLKEKQDSFLDDLLKVAQGSHSPCSFAAYWLESGLEEVLKLLYLITAETVKTTLTKKVGNNEQSFLQLSHLISPPQLYYQLDQINALIKKINHNINVNPLLALDNILLGFVNKK